MNRKLHRATTGVAGAALAAIMALGVAGCSQPDDGPQSLDEVEASYEANNPDAASDEPTQSEADAAKQEKLASATERYKAYLATRDEFAKKGKSGGAELRSQNFYGSQEIMEADASFWNQITENKLKQTGQQKLVDTTLVELQGDPLASLSGNRLVIDACVDATAVDIVRPNGSSALADGGQGRGIVRLEMQGQGDEQDSWWSIAKANKTEKEC